MKIDVTETDSGVSVIKPNGRLNAVAVPLLRKVLQQSVDSGSRRLVVDLSEIEFIDSSGLGALIGGLKTARAAGGDLRIASAAVQVQTVLKLTNLDRVLRPHASIEEAYADA